MKVAIHFPDLKTAPDLAAHVEDGVLITSDHEATSSTILALDVLHEKVDGIRWEDYFDQLAERNPGPAGAWEVFDIPEGGPENLLRTLRRAG